MKQPGAFLHRFAVCALVVALTACGGSGDKIGSTVKGTRVAVLEKQKAVEADTELQGTRPQLSGIIMNKAWAQAGYDAVHMMPNANIGNNPQVAWTANVGAGSDSDYKLLSRPVVNNNMVFTMDAQGVVKAFQTKDGDRVWDFDTKPEDADNDAIAGGLAADGNTLYVTTGFGEVLSLASDSGKVRWRHKLENPLRAAPTVADNRVYVVSIDNRLTALNANNGEETWHHDGIAESATLMGASNPAVLGDSIIVTYSSGEIYNLRAENGRVSWSYALTTAAQAGALPAIADIRGLPVIDRGNVYAVSHSGRLASIDHRTGDRVWEADIGSINTPMISGDTMFVLSNDGQLIALTRETGRVIWVHELQHLSDPDDHDSDPVYWTGPVLGGSKLWLGNSLGQLVSFSPDDGKEIDNIDLGDPIYMPPVIAGGTIYAVTDEGSLVALR